MKCRFAIPALVGVLSFWIVPSNADGDERPYTVIFTVSEVLTIDEKLIDEQNTYVEPTGESLIISLHWLEDIMGPDTGVTYSIETKSDSGVWNPISTVLMNPYTQQTSKAECFINMFNNFKGEDESDGVLDLLGGDEGFNKKGQTWVSEDMKVDYGCLPEHITAPSEFKIILEIIKDGATVFTNQILGLIEEK